MTEQLIEQAREQWMNAYAVYYYCEGQYGGMYRSFFWLQ